MAKAAGEEIKTAVAIPAGVALTSSILYGNQFDMGRISADVSAVRLVLNLSLFEGLRK